MEKLKRLVDIFTVKKVSQIDILTNQETNTTKSSLLLNGIRKGAIKSDKDAMDILYPDGNKKAYRKLKNRLFNRLLNTLFFIDVKGINKTLFIHNRDHIFKEYCQIKLIESHSHRELAVQMAMKLLDRSDKYKVFDISLLLCDFLQEHYSIWQPNIQLSKKYGRAYQKNLGEIQKLREVTPIWAGLAELIMVKKSLANQSKELDMYYEQLCALNKRGMKKDRTNFLMVFRLYSAWYFFYWLSQEFNKQLDICDEYLDEFHTESKEYPVHFFTFLMYKSIAYLNLGNYDSSEQQLLSILGAYDITPGRVHWLNINNYLFLVRIIQKRYEQAATMMAEVTQLRKFQSINEKWREPWLIKEAYINLLIKMDKINLDSMSEIKFRKFRVSRFVNDVPLYSKDKRGLNVSILIAQFIFLLIDNRTDEMHDRLDGLKQYSFRYLRNDFTLRSNCFIKMLVKIPGAGFHPVRVENHTKKLKEKLYATPMMISEQSYEVEIIPYEDLWEIVMEVLQKRKGKVSL